MAISKIKYDLPYIPDELIADHILPLLPVISLIRIKTVCKRWLHIISSPIFVKSHLEQSLVSRNCFLIKSHPIRNDSSIRSTPTECFLLHCGKEIGYKLDQLDVRSEFQLDPELYRRNCIVGSCDGLLCFYFDSEIFLKNRFLLWNPATRSSRIIETPCVDHLTRCGFGYASNIDDYKNFASFQSIQMVIRYTGSSPLVVGTINTFLVSHCRAKISKKLPPDTENIRYKLFVSRGYLALFSDRDEYGNDDDDDEVAQFANSTNRVDDIWRLMACDSWVKWFTISWNFPRVLAFSPTGKYLVHPHSQELKVVDSVVVDESKSEGMIFEGYPMHSESHVESLVSPN
ncbi:uncharacterized protein [Spinacia oleracea]|uniref:F-box domain-containing protein n=1 Tax=Spinacia oleracea TaxID=3562 RepID=A0ABM3RI35_SPIOL|nr:uncharacterized protein LOC130469815 [Spinacia oleracea]